MIVSVKSQIWQAADHAVLLFRMSGNDMVVDENQRANLRAQESQSPSTSVHNPTTRGTSHDSKAKFWKSRYGTINT